MVSSFLKMVYVDNYFILMYTIPDLSSYISFNFMVADNFMVVENNIRY